MKNGSEFYNAKITFWVVETERTFYDLIFNVETNKGPNYTVLKLQELLGLPFQLKIALTDENINKNVFLLQQQFQISYSLKEVELEAIERVC